MEMVCDESEGRSRMDAKCV